MTDSKTRKPKRKRPNFGRGYYEVTSVGERVDRANPPKMPASSLRVVKTSHEPVIAGLYLLVRVCS
jgi:hypothetical protein